MIRHDDIVEVKHGFYAGRRGILFADRCMLQYQVCWLDYSLDRGGECSAWIWCWNLRVVGKKPDQKHEPEIYRLAKGSRTDLANRA